MSKEQNEMDMQRVFRQHKEVSNRLRTEVFVNFRNRNYELIDQLTAEEQRLRLLILDYSDTICGDTSSGGSISSSARAVNFCGRTK